MSRDNRRGFLKVIGSALAWANVAPRVARGASGSASHADELGTFDYIVVGSGAGGGPVACRLAEKGYSVLILEAGDDQGRGDNLHYSVPAYHPFSVEDPTMRWDFYVKHYDDPSRAGLDHKYDPEHGGV